MDAIWRGHITFGLVSIPVGLYGAVESSERVSFRLLHKKDKAPIKYKKFCSAEDIEVGNDEIVRGYQVGKNRYVTIEEEERHKVQEKVGEGELGSIDPLLFEKPYYLAPEKEGAQAYAVLRAALTEARRVGIARSYLRTKPILTTLIPGAKALALAALRPYEELRDPAELPIPDRHPKSAEVKLARTLIDQLSDAWDPTERPNEYRKALEKLLASKWKFSVKVKETKSSEKVVNLMEVLRRSVRGSGPLGKERRAPARRARAA